MKLIAIIFTFLYAALILIALVKSKNKGLPALLMTIGAMLSLSYLVVRSHGNPIGLFIAGMCSISAGTLLNGIRQKNVHISHHLIRAGMEFVLVMLFLL